MMGSEWNPRFEAYSRALNFKTPGECFDAGHPKPQEFAAWNNEQVREFLKQYPEHDGFGTLGSKKAHAAYDEWLQKKFPKAERYDADPKFKAFLRATGLKTEEAWKANPPSLAKWMNWNRDHVCEFGAIYPRHFWRGRLTSIEAELAYEQWLEKKYPIVEQ